MSCSTRDINDPHVYLLREGGGGWMAISTEGTPPGVIAAKALTLHACYGLLLPTSHVLSRFTAESPENIAADFLAERGIVDGRYGSDRIIPVFQEIKRQLHDGADLFALLQPFILTNLPR